MKTFKLLDREREMDKEHDSDLQIYKKLLQKTSE